MANQTEFVYTVFVGNKPILAVTAADDMQLVSTAEVVNTLGSQVLTKSERKKIIQEIIFIFNITMFYFSVFKRTAGHSIGTSHPCSPK